MTSFIEIIVAMFILSLALLGLDASQITAIRQAKSIYFANLALDQLEIMVEQLNVVTGQTRHEMQAQWDRQNQARLPNGRGHLSIDGEASIHWGEGDSSSCSPNKVGQTGCLRFSINQDEGERRYLA